MGNNIAGFIKRILSLPILVAGVIVVVGGLGYLAGTLAIHQQVQVEATFAPVIVPQVATPVIHFSQLDPAISGYLEYGQPRYGIIPLSALGPDIAPIGAFLPRTGDRAIEVIGVS